MLKGSRSLPTGSLREPCYCHMGQLKHYQYLDHGKVFTKENQHVKKKLSCKLMAPSLYNLSYQ